MLKRSYRELWSFQVAATTNPRSARLVVTLLRKIDVKLIALPTLMSRPSGKLATDIGRFISEIMQSNFGVFAHLPMDNTGPHVSYDLSPKNVMI